MVKKKRRPFHTNQFAKTLFFLLGSLEVLCTCFSTQKNTRRSKNPEEIEEVTLAVRSLMLSGQMGIENRLNGAGLAGLRRLNAFLEFQAASSNEDPIE